MSTIKANNIKPRSDSNPLVLSTNSTERLRVTDGGNVGIGTSSPTSALHVSGTVTATTVQVSTTATAASFVGNGIVPVGGIVFWSGTIASIPSGWALCNGNNGTPDLRNKFIVGASTDSSGAKTTITGSATQTGGSKDAVVVQHSHTASTSSAGSHSHFSFVAAVDGTPVSSNTLTTTQSVASVQAGGGSTFAYGLKPSSSASTLGLTNTAGSHSHTVTVDDAGSSDGTDANLPPYYALAFIMRIS